MSIVHLIEYLVNQGTNSSEQPQTDTEKSTEALATTKDSNVVVCDTAVAEECAQKAAGNKADEIAPEEAAAEIAHEEEEATEEAAAEKANDEAAKKDAEGGISIEEERAEAQAEKEDVADKDVEAGKGSSDIEVVTDDAETRTSTDKSKVIFR